MSDYPLTFKIAFGFAGLCAIISLINIVITMIIIFPYQVKSEIVAINDIPILKVPYMIIEYTFPSFFITIIGYLQGVQSGFGVIIKYGWGSVRVKLLMILFTVINILQILYEIITAIFNPTIEIQILVNIINGFGIWGSIGIVITSIIIFMDILFSHDADPEFSVLSKLSLAMNIFTFSIYFISGLFHFKNPFPHDWIFLLWTFWTFMGFTTVAYGHHTETYQK